MKVHRLENALVYFASYYSHRSRPGICVAVFHAFGFLRRFAVVPAGKNSTFYYGTHRRPSVSQNPPDHSFFQHGLDPCCFDVRIDGFVDRIKRCVFSTVCFVWPDGSVNPAHRVCSLAEGWVPAGAYCGGNCSSEGGGFSVVWDADILARNIGQNVAP